MVKYWLRKTLLGLCWLAIGVGVISRVVLLQVSYEYDELFTAITSDPSLSWVWIWKNWLMVDVHPPLHNFILYLYNHVVPFGPEIWLRLPSVFFTFIGLVLSWLMFPKRWGKTARMIFVGMLATHAYTIVYAQHARAYALMLCLAIPLTFWFLQMASLVRRCKKVPSKWWVRFGVCALLLSWSHYFGALVSGVMFCILFVLAVWRKQKLLPFVLVPCLVFLLFCPWFLPNLYTNLFLKRFSGNWWGNSIQWNQIPARFAVFFFSSFWAMGLCTALSAWGLWLRWRPSQGKRRAAGTWNIALLAAVCGAVLGIAIILSLKANMMIGRYFTPMLPCFFLLFTLAVAPAVRRYSVAVIFLIGIFGCGLYVWAAYWFSATHTLLLPARTTFEVFQNKYWPKKELYVVAMEAFPPASMDAMYGFYLNKVFHATTPVHEIYNLPADQREAFLARRDNAVIFMPNCTLDKLSNLSREWKRSVGVEQKMELSCFLRLADEGEMGLPKQWAAESDKWKEVRK